MVADDVGTLVAHHLFRTCPARVNRGEDPGLRWILEAHTASAEDLGHELMHLSTQLIVNNGLVEDLEELPICALKAPEQFVAHERRGEAFRQNFRRPVQLLRRLSLHSPASSISTITGL